MLKYKDDVPISKISTNVETIRKISKIVTYTKTKAILEITLIQKLKILTVHNNIEGQGHIRKIMKKEYSLSRYKVCGIL